MKTLVVGGAGFIGSNLVDVLVGDNKEVVVLDNLSTGKIENINGRARFVFADICNFDEIYPHFAGVDVVFHLAALPRVDPSIVDPVGFNKINVDGTLNVFWAAKKQGVKHIVFSSSSSVYGNAKTVPTSETEPTDPMSPYALQKLVCEQYAKLFCSLYGMNITCLRYFNVYGNREPTEGAYVPVIGIWLRQLKAGHKLTITGDGTQSRDFVNVQDVASANRLAAMKMIMGSMKGHNVFNIGSGMPHTLNEIAEFITTKDNITYLPPRMEPHKTMANVEAFEHATFGLWQKADRLWLYLQKELTTK